MTSKSPVLRSRTLPHVLAIALGAAGCFGVAFWAKDRIEQQAMIGLNLAFTSAGHEWVDVAVDGLSVSLGGVAEDEATRFAALSTAGRVVDATRVIDNMEVRAAAAIKAPDFSVEILKNDDRVSLIGLVPEVSDPESIVDQVEDISGEAVVSDLLETASFDAPSGWNRALSFGVDALKVLPSSKISISPARVVITAVAEDPTDKDRIERRLKRSAPAGLLLNLNISAPRPVVAPFTLRFVIDENGSRFDACAADSEPARRAILDVARAAGAEKPECVLALGTPSTRWGEAATAGIEALSNMGRGTLTMSNADITLVANEGMAASVFERTAAELEAALPPVFSLSAILPASPEAPDPGAAQPPEFIVTRSPEGQVQLRGKLGDEKTRAAVESFAAAHFGSDRIYSATRIDPNVPPGWPLRVLTALEAMQHLHNGLGTVTEDNIAITGATGTKNAQSQMTRILSSKLDSGASFNLEVSYREALDPKASIPTPEDCISLIEEAGNKQKITFAPSSTNFEDDAVKTIDAIATILRECTDVRIEIGGHTDSQGREEMNQQLSQARADAVLNAIMARRVLVSNLSARGYGEILPVADNGTEAGREANRRIEFRLVSEEDVARAASEPDSVAIPETTDPTEETQEERSE